MERKSGILNHPTSLPSKHGIGGLGDEALDFIDFLKKSDQTLWQVLPLGHTSFKDSPYQSFSAFAGNILLISPEELVKEGFAENEDIPKYSGSGTIDYGNVIKHKTAIFKKAYRNFLNSADKSLKKEYGDFCSENEFWLDDYSLFVAIKEYYINERKSKTKSDEYKAYAKRNPKLEKSQVDDYYYGAVWNSWEEGLKNKKPEILDVWREKLKETIGYYEFLQFVFFKQWEKVKKYANYNEVEIIGDMPIFAAEDSADVWGRKELFCLNAQGSLKSVAGVPPDYFSEKGQLWGNPLYDFKTHAKEGYSFWISRIKHMLKMFDYIRIDHFRGFESYWEIKSGSPDATKGRWVKAPGLELFRAVKKSLGNLPIIAEDLGIITKEVEALRESCGFPGMKVLQFGFDEGIKNTNMPHNFTTSNIVVYTGTHDNSTTAGWYEKQNENVRDIFRRYMNTAADEPSWDMIRLAFSSIADFAVIPIQDILSLSDDFRMNTPGESEGCWQFSYQKDMLNDTIAERLKYLSRLFDRNTKNT